VAASAQPDSAEPLRVLAVTVLTSFNQQDVEAMGIRTNVSDVVLSRAQLARQLGCGGVIASGHEVSRLRRECGDLIFVIPGIRPAVDRSRDVHPRPRLARHASEASAITSGRSPGFSGAFARLKPD
jgi:orotidine-5'-phosphate decarboxylase